MENNATSDQVYKEAIQRILASGLRFCELCLADRMQVIWAYRETWTEYMDGNDSRSTHRMELFKLIVGLTPAGTMNTPQEARSYD